jgi:hypothetical protein
MPDLANPFYVRPFTPNHTILPSSQSGGHSQNPVLDFGDTGLTMPSILVRLAVPMLNT